MQDDNEGLGAPAVMATGQAGQLAVALANRTVAMYHATWPAAALGQPNGGSGLGWEMWTRPLLILVAIAVGVWQYSRRRCAAISKGVISSYHQSQNTACIAMNVPGLSAR